MASAGHDPHTIQRHVIFNNSHESSMTLRGYHQISKVTITCFLELAKDCAPVPNFINVMVDGESIGIIEVNGSGGKSQPFRYGSCNYAIFDTGLSTINLQDIKDKKSVAITGNMLIQFEIEHKPAQPIVYGRHYQ